MVERLEPGLVVSSGAGFCVGAVTAGWTWALYPPARDRLWPIATVAIASIALVLLVYATAARLDLRRAGDFLVLGYALALFGAGTLAVSREIAAAVRARVPENIGVKTATACDVQGSNGIAGAPNAGLARTRRGAGEDLIPPWGHPLRVTTSIGGAHGWSFCG
jgi:hypothetical protein